MPAEVDAIAQAVPRAKTLDGRINPLLSMWWRGAKTSNMVAKLARDLDILSGRSWGLQISGSRSTDNGPIGAKGSPSPIWPVTEARRLFPRAAGFFACADPVLDRGPSILPHTALFRANGIGSLDHLRRFLLAGHHALAGDAPPIEAAECLNHRWPVQGSRKRQNETQTIHKGGSLLGENPGSALSGNQHGGLFCVSGRATGSTLQVRFIHLGVKHRLQSGLIAAPIEMQD
jgi:hypothetical protein